MATTKLILGIGLALLVAVDAGWVQGASDRSNSDRAFQIAELRAELLEGRAAMPDARLDIYSVNLGEASLSRTEDAKSLEPRRLGSTRRSVSPASFNQDANALAADAAKTISDVLGRIAKR